MTFAGAGEAGLTDMTAEEKKGSVGESVDKERTSDITGDEEERVEEQLFLNQLHATINNNN